MQLLVATLIPGGWQTLLILLVVLLLFGHRIPSMARALGSGIVEFRKGLKGESDPDAPRIGDGNGKKKDDA
ncbi:MAG: twin-arginine translocase TatA/TatE family subunit [Planctomycetes bacterium]|nr:twin-arginine translocase TatA/TatE family subunit [Planctomycetota bacterium]